VSLHHPKRKEKETQKEIKRKSREIKENY